MAMSRLVLFLTYRVPRSDQESRKKFRGMICDETVSIFHNIFQCMLAEYP